jgi:low temperature requirement protein LtrA
MSDIAELVVDQVMLILAIRQAKKCRPQVRVSHPFGLPVLSLASTNLALACGANFSTSSAASTNIFFVKFLRKAKTDVHLQPL